MIANVQDKEINEIFSYLREKDINDDNWCDYIKKNHILELLEILSKGEFYKVTDRLSQDFCATICLLLCGFHADILKEYFDVYILGIGKKISENALFQWLTVSYEPMVTQEKCCISLEEVSLAEGIIYKTFNDEDRNNSYQNLQLHQVF